MNLNITYILVLIEREAPASTNKITRNEVVIIIFEDRETKEGIFIISAHSQLETVAVFSINIGVRNYCISKTEVYKSLVRFIKIRWTVPLCILSKKRICVIEIIQGTQTKRNFAFFKIFDRVAKTCYLIGSVEQSIDSGIHFVTVIPNTRNESERAITYLNFILEINS